MTIGTRDNNTSTDVGSYCIQLGDHVPAVPSGTTSEAETP